MTAPPQADLDIIVESEMIKIAEAGEAQPEGTTREPATSPPEGEQEPM